MIRIFYFFLYKLDFLDKWFATCECEELSIRIKIPEQVYEKDCQQRLNIFARNTYKYV